ncbi:sterol desaturase family protein [Mongoliibacter ruber]|uniref:Sterol desaturase/sphingolipid hydroxylase (Fatty acid hydroxylase superfamily) n=1 Tax=Mongoliibacter ruber TaxID=1750599 RepID=A0A2T0WSI4_9BACT|nr:sterol desaturase family protein [Mongoliibacter ruber]PRY89652.1 sterol desaturase/sphingolipid hydroxylase (fatty acid hydroxylase superfamily) [Mongoliibacter ruber]
MNKETLTFEQITNMDLPNIILYAAPVMIALVAFEWYLSYRQKKDFYDGKDTVAALVIGLINVGMSAAIKVITFGIILFFYNLVPWTIPMTWWAFIICLFWLDFWRYWAHRIAHENRFWWATHVTHHNSEKYNWSVSFRLSWTQHIKIIFFIPVALAGFHPVVFFIVHQLAVLYQFWIHTEYITKLPRPIEYFFTTPSHHRVHHATNEKYLDKNYGSTFIIWDRIFGTFQPEEEKPNYGLTTQVNSYNPITLNFHEWSDIVRDVKNSRSLKEAYAMVFTRPSELEAKKKEFEAAYEKSRLKVNG